MELIVLTGGPCSGKSSLISTFEKRGFPVVREVARDILAKRGKRPVTREELFALQYEIGERQMLEEEKARIKYSEKETVFLDRGLPDLLAYYHILLNFVHLQVDDRMKNRYKKVFFLDRLPFVNDGLRSEDDNKANDLHNSLSRHYKLAGYSPIRVPALPINERADFVLSHVNRMKGGKMKHAVI